MLREEELPVREEVLTVVAPHSLPAKDAPAQWWTAATLWAQTRPQGCAEPAE